MFNLIQFSYLLGSFGLVASIFQLENFDIEDKFFVSPFARHRLNNIQHYTLFIVHDVSAFLCLSLFFCLLHIGKANKNHKLIGRIFIIPLAVAVVSGFCLCNKRSQDSKYSASASMLFSVTLGSQGWNIINISMNAFVPKQLIKNRTFSLCLIFFHAYDFYLGIKSLRILISLIFQSTGIPSDSSLAETASNLLFIMTLPQLTNEAIYIWIHYWNRKRNYSTFSWPDHHNMSVFFLVFMCLPGVFFSFAHDKYWVFYPAGIQTPALRAIVMMSPMVAMVIFNMPMIVKSLNSHFIPILDKN